MQIEIFQNNRAVRPTTVWKSLSDMYNYLEETKPILHICKKLAETGDKSLKQNLPAMMPMGNSCHDADGQYWRQNEKERELHPNWHCHD